MSRTRESAERVALLQVLAVAQIHGLDMRLSEMPKTDYLHKHGGLFANQSKHQAHGHEARVANIQKKMPHR